MALNNYAKPALFLDGTAIEQLTSLEMSTDGGKTRINLMQKGLGGFSLGVGAVTLTIGYALPRSGQEYPYQQKCANDDFVTAQVRWGGEQYSGSGQMMTDSKNSASDSPTEGSVNWDGELKEME